MNHVRTGILARPRATAAPPAPGVAKLRNPLLALPSAGRLHELDPLTREIVAAIFVDLAVEADQLAEVSWLRRKAPMAAYWRAVCTYSRHFARAVRRAGRT